MTEPTLLTLLRDTRYRAFWLGQITSVVGNGIRIVALPALILSAHDGRTYGIVLAVDSLFAVLLLLFGGAIADRYSRTSVMAWSDVIRAVGITGYLVFGGTTHLAGLLVSAALVGAGTAAFQPAHRAALPQIVPAELRQKANSLDAATGQLGLAVGAGLGGVLVATVGPQRALMIDVATFAISLVTLFWIRLPRIAQVAGAVRTSLFAEVREGIAQVRSRTWAWVIMVQGTAQVFLVFAPYFALVPVASAERYGIEAYGWISAAGSIGMIAGSTLAGRVTTKRPGLWAMNALAPSALLPLCLAFQVPLAVFCAAAFLAWAGIGVFVVFWFTALQREFPAEVQGRVFALESVATFGLEPIALAVAPVLAYQIGLSTFAVIATVVLIATTYAVLFVRGAIELSSAPASVTARV
ncbi:MFS family permease [Allocatelliglobosispora scoriae]|uniref:MFS family permease n=1 Tax=Allocatelliglobosispora scoriae TaxID=643052 RepID=A0A841C056_9ACTN|nr:MFS transporter [Allocatelliglobosispora scoriae]MBB5873128.1 MFS family permease [Allocatelliglobosispora scoriae]